MSEVATTYQVEYPALPDVEIPSNGSKYNNQERLQAVVIYAVYGNIKRTAKLSGIPQDTIYGWTRQEWWSAALNKVNEQKSNEFNAGFSRLIGKSIEVIEKQLNNEEVKALDAAKIMGIAFDKRQILNNLPTSISGKAKGINDLAEEFERYVSAKEVNAEVQKD